MPDNLGIMNNDEQGDCAEAGVYHLRQVQTFITTGTMDTQPDSVVQSLYQRFGFDPTNPASTDNGTNLQDLLTDWLKNGIPLADGTTEKLLAFFEVDPTNLDHMKEVINDCGGIYLGINLPQAIEDDNYPAEWDVKPGMAIAGGHCIIGVDYAPSHTPDSRFDDEGMTVQSWGEWNLMKPDTESYIEEAYGLVTESWVMKTGKTPLNMTPEQLEEQMAPLRVAA